MNTRFAPAHSLRLTGGAGNVPRRLIILLGVFIFLIGGLGPNLLLAGCSVLLFVMGLTLLWRPMESPILLFLFVYQWLQISMPLFHANWLGMDLINYSRLHGNLGLSSFLSLVGLVVVVTGIHAGARGLTEHVSVLARQQAYAITTTRIFSLYLAALAVGLAAKWLSAYAGGLRQPLLAVDTLHWAFYFMLVYVSLVRRERGRQYWLLAFLFELLVSLGGFFSGFKTVFFYTFFAMFAAGVRLSLRQALGLSVLVVILFTMSVAWSAIKPDYRMFLNKGTGMQVVMVGYGERLTKLAGLVGDLGAEDLSDGLDALLRRIGYTDYFGRVLATVPEYMPHTGGEIWWDALRRPFMPRLFFPEKAVVDDSIRTTLYTGDYINPGTSISIGYMAEAYLDFGPWGMMLLLLIYGYAIGRAYRWLLANRQFPGLVGMGLATAALFVTVLFESSATKVLGGLALNLLVAWLFLHWVAPRLFPQVQRRMAH